MFNKRAVSVLVISFTLVFSVWQSAFALTLDLPLVGPINIGGSSSGSSNTGTTDQSSSSSITSTLNNIVQTILPSSSNLSSSGNTGTIASVVQSVPALLNNSSSGNTNPVLPIIDLEHSTIPGGLSLVYSQDNDTWKTSSTILRAGFSKDIDAENSTLLTMDGQSVSRQRIYTSLNSSNDWSQYSKLGIWILPESDTHNSELALFISQERDPSDTSTLFTVPLPGLKKGTWQYVTVDLTNCPPDILRAVASYGFSVLPTVKHSIHFYPPELGPGVLHHLHVKVVTPNIPVFGKPVTVRVTAEDQFGNVLDSGKNVYQGVKQLVFSDTQSPDDPITVLGKSLGTDVAVNFNNGTSDPVVVNSTFIPAAAYLNVSDGTASSSSGDLSLGALINGTSSVSPSTDPTQSMITVTPDHATINSPELITVTAYDSSGTPRTVGGDNVTSIITGANAQTLPLVDLGNGIYQGVYTPTHTGTDIIKATINNVLVMNDTQGASDGVFSLPVTAATTTIPSSGGGFSGGGGTASDLTPASCGLYMTKYIQYGAKNDPAEVKKLQLFLQGYDFGKDVKISGIYDLTTFTATKEFQKQYVSNILSPWNLAEATGYVYILTLREINIIHCMSLPGANSAWATSVVVSKAPYCPYFETAATLGAKGNEVAKAQQFLKDMNMLSKSAPLGTFGKLTLSAVKKFQTNYIGSDNATGRWGPLTMKAANQVLGCQIN